MKHIIIALLMNFFALAGMTQENYDLKQCLEIGLEQNYDIRIVRNQEEISENNNTLGNAGYLPTVNLNAGYSGTLNNMKQDLVDNGGSIQNNNILDQNAIIGLNLDWMVFDGFRIQSNHHKLKELEEMGALYTQASIENFIADLVAEYYNFVQQNIRMKNLTASVALSKERLRIVGARYNIGSMSRLDLQQARVDFNTDSSLLIKQIEILHTSRIRLNELMALEQVSQNTVVKDSVIDINAFLEKETLWEKTLKANVLLLLSQKTTTLSELETKMLRSRNYPYLKMNAGYGYDFNKYQLGLYDRQQTLGLNYGLSLEFTVFDGMNRKREQKNARIVEENSRLQYEQLMLKIEADFANIWMAYQNNLDLVNLEKENLTTAKENYAIAIERYKLGDLSGIELREAQNSLLAAEERLLLAQYNTKLCEVSLMQISGQGSVYLLS